MTELLQVVTLVASRSGLEALCKMHPDVQVHLASIDELAEVRALTRLDNKAPETGPYLQYRINSTTIAKMRRISRKIPQNWSREFIARPRP